VVVDFIGTGVAVGGSDNLDVQSVFEGDTCNLVEIDCLRTVYQLTGVK
jgi:hypothetical protein